MSQKFLSDKGIEQLEDAADGIFVVPPSELSDEERKLNDKVTKEIILNHKKQRELNQKKKD